MAIAYHLSKSESTMVISRFNKCSANNCIRKVLTLVTVTLLTFVCFGCSATKDRASQLKGYLGYIEWEEPDHAQLKLVNLEQDIPRIIQTNVVTVCISWSPTLDQIAYAHQGNIYVYNITKTTLMTFETGFFRLTAPVWASSALIFAGQQNLNQTGMDIWKLDLSTGDLQLLVQCASSASSVDSCDSPVWLPDKRVGYLRYSGTKASIEVLDPESQSTEIMVNGLQIRPSAAPFGVKPSYDNRNYSNLSWSSDGSWIAFVGGKGTFPYDSGIYIFETSTRKISMITSRTIWADSPVWIDEKNLAFRTRTWAKGAEIADSYERGNYDAINISIINIDTQKVDSITQNIPPSPVNINCLFYISQDFPDDITLPWETTPSSSIMP